MLLLYFAKPSRRRSNLTKLKALRPSHHPQQHLVEHFQETHIQSVLCSAVLSSPSFTTATHFARSPAPANQAVKSLSQHPTRTGSGHNNAPSAPLSSRAQLPTALPAQVLPQQRAQLTLAPRSHPLRRVIPVLPPGTSEGLRAIPPTVITLHDLPTASADSLKPEVPSHLSLPVLLSFPIRRSHLCVRHALADAWRLMRHPYSCLKTSETSFANSLPAGKKNFCFTRNPSPPSRARSSLAP